MSIINLSLLGLSTISKEKFGRLKYPLTYNYLYRGKLISKTLANMRSTPQQNIVIEYT